MTTTNQAARLVFGLASMLSLPAQVPRDNRGLMMDPSLPFVGLEYKAVRKWKPVFDGESQVGVWLTLHNNTIYPITVGTINEPNKNQGLLIVHEVYRVKTVVPLPRGQEPLPAGEVINRYLGGDVRNNVEIAPGAKLDFGLPAEHISRGTYIRVNFEMALPVRAKRRQPRTSVDFYWVDLPHDAQVAIEKLRALR